ncbi:hypothetical protein [Kineococcus rhizosphaerae]|uniref:Uncharacterized protein n=1 Tax=Kineococcus rhizosphaerae TaxID=559628 RepID=A0A2T0QWS3_9ACTN|nr:hypothetical protein [Kineococcus rhizosphaerae]PRY09921.1 hypothetical protein CLV37_11929 [Kineococcus rhizosphaerae]
MFSTSATVNTLVTALPAGNDVFTTVDNIGSSTANTIDGLAVAVGFIAAAGVLWATGFKFTLLRCFLAAFVGACAYLAVSDWQMFTDVIKQTFQNATGGGK